MWDKERQHQGISTQIQGNEIYIQQTSLLQEVGAIEIIPAEQKWFWIKTNTERNEEDGSG